MLDSQRGVSCQGFALRTVVSVVADLCVCKSDFLQDVADFGPMSTISSKCLLGMKLVSENDTRAKREAVGIATYSADLNLYPNTTVLVDVPIRWRYRSSQYRRESLVVATLSPSPTGFRSRDFGFGNCSGAGAGRVEDVGVRISEPCVAAAATTSTLGVLVNPNASKPNICGSPWSLFGVRMGGITANM